MSKKLIAVASATALALSALVGVAPANAAAPEIAIVGGAGSGSSAAGTEAAPRTIGVPFENTIVAGTSAVTLELHALDAGDVVSVTTTGSVKILLAAVAAASKNVNHTTLGTTSFSSTRSADGDLDLFIYTTSTTTGTVAVEVKRTGLTSSNTYHIKGNAGEPVNITAVSGVPQTLAKGATSVVSFTMSDVFGNAVEAYATTSAVVRSTEAIMAAITFDAAAKVYKSTMTSGTNDAFIGSLTINNGASDATRDRDGLPVGKRSLIAVVNSAATATANAAATAQIAALTAQLANSRGKDVSVTKKKYNTLARKWNRAFPRQAVKLKK